MCSDAAAATFLLNIPAYNAYYGRRKCVTPGVWVANISTVTMTKNVVLPFFSSFTYEKKTEKGVKYWGCGRHRSIPSVKLNFKHREPFSCTTNFHGYSLYISISRCSRPIYAIWLCWEN
jgi:hypothetical protein